MIQFDFATPQRILFGAGRFQEVGRLAAGLGARLALVTGGQSLERSGALAALESQFPEHGAAWWRVTIAGEPTAEAIDAAVADLREFAPEAIVAVGGGSVLDAAKAIAALLANGGEVLDYLETVGRGRALTRPALPCLAVPTTAGTGAEATKNAVIGDRARTFKRSMRADGMLPAIAVIDPELTRGCPREVAAACGMDALTQLLEAFTSRRASPLTDGLAREGLRAAGALFTLAKGDFDAAARERMSLASLLGGVCLANAGLGAVHGLASPLGAYFPIPHGAICATLLPAVIRVNAAAAPEGAELNARYREAAALLLGEPLEPEALAARLSEFWRGIMGNKSGLTASGVGEPEFARIIAEGRGNSMKTNPVELSDAQLRTILEQAS